MVQGPGCLNYSLVLNISRNDSLQSVTQTNRFIMERHRELFQTHSDQRVDIQGHTDLAMGGLKFSGNAQRRKKKYLLFHGSFLLDFNLSLIEELLKMPSRQPEYRRSRPHREFLMNLTLKPFTVKELMRSMWKASDLPGIKFAPSEALIHKYRGEEWNRKL